MKNKLKIGTEINKFGTRLLFLYRDKYNDLYFLDLDNKRQRIFSSIFFDMYEIEQTFKI